jgi:hypothetical protein
MTDGSTVMRTALLAVLCLSAGCSDTTPAPAKSDGPRDAAAPPVGRTLFTKLPASYTGVRFENRLVETDSLNVFVYRNFYNGGGVAIGDLNGDSLPDLILGSNLKGPAVFLNEGAGSTSTSVMPASVMPTAAATNSGSTTARAPTASPPSASRPRPTASTMTGTRRRPPSSTTTGTATST